MTDLTSQQRPGRPLSADRESGYGSDVDLHLTIKSLERLDLEDDGKRNWYEESKMYLNEHWGDKWKDLKETIMVPESLDIHPLKATTGDRTEKRVFELLKEFGNKNQEPMFVVHSHDFCELIHNLENGHESGKKWVQGEHDFVIIHPKYGVIFLEVKSNENTKGVYKEGKRQIEKAKASINSYLKKCFGKSKPFRRATFEWPAFVVMPNCKRPEKQPHDDVVYLEDCTSQDTFKEWWDGKIAACSTQIDPHVFEELVIKFVPFSCLLPTLNLQIDKTHDNIVKVFTPKQLESWYNSSPVQWISGPAGSGKTILLIEKVKHILTKMKIEDDVRRILVLCFNVPLSSHLDNEINGWFQSNYKTDESPVKVKTYDSFIKEVGGFDSRDLESFEERRNIVEAMYTVQGQDPPEQHMYEHIFVDEGQDLLGNKWPKFLEKLHKKPNPRCKYYFWVMFDSNQHVQLTDTNDLPWEYLRNASELTYVLRNTNNIFSLSKKYYKGISEEEIKLGHAEVGLDVVWDDTLKENRLNKAEIVYNHITKYKRKKVQPKDITVLARTGKAAQSLMNDLGALDVVNAETRLETKENVTAVESIRRFKGLESKVVILFDPKYYTHDGEINKTRQLLYTAVSRCFCLLIIVSTREGCERIKNAATHLPITYRSAAFSSASSSSASHNSIQEKRKKPEKFTNLVKENNEEERHSTFNPYGKRARVNDYNSGPPERKQFVDKTDRDEDVDETIQSGVKIDKMEEKQMQRYYERNQKLKEKREVCVPGCDILEPGDKFIPDEIRLNAFGLLATVVKENLSFSGNAFSDNQVKGCVQRIEYKTYQIHHPQRNSRPYTKALRSLKKEIQNNNKNKQLNSTVEEALSEM